MAVAVFHKIGEPTEDKFTHSIEQILNFDGQITFDGVYESVYKHRESLKNRDIILFVTGFQIGEEGFCNIEQLSEMCQDYGFHFGWHGWTHSKLTELPDHAVIAELSTPPQIHVLPFYAYPHGEFDERTQKLVKEMGFKQAYSTTQGEDGNDFAIPRIYI